MAILMSLLEDGVVTDFNDIRNAYVAHQEAAYKYWDDLREKASRIAFGLEEYLGLKGVTHDVPGKSPERYVKVGVIENGAFKEGHQLNFEAKELSLHFAISLTLDQAPQSFPKHNLVFPLEISFKDFTYWVAVALLGTTRTVRIPSDFNVAYQNELYELIARSVIDKLNPSVFQ